MDVSDLVILACAAGFAIAALVGMMNERHKQLLQQRASEIDPMGEDLISIGRNIFGMDFILRISFRKNLRNSALL